MLQHLACKQLGNGYLDILCFVVIVSFLNRPAVGYWVFSLLVCFTRPSGEKRGGKGRFTSSKF